MYDDITYFWLSYRDHFQNYMQIKFYFKFTILCFVYPTSNLFWLNIVLHVIVWSTRENPQNLIFQVSSEQAPLCPPSYSYWRHLFSSQSNYFHLYNQSIEDKINLECSKKMRMSATVNSQVDKI